MSGKKRDLVSVTIDIYHYILHRIDFLVDPIHMADSLRINIPFNFYLHFF